MRTILVTGASKGIGSAIAVALAKRGFGVAIHYRADRDGALRTEAAAREAGAATRLLCFDVSDREACRAAIAADIAANGAYYGVVNNAGVHRDNAFPLLTGEDWDVVLARISTASTTSCSRA